MSRQDEQTMDQEEDRIPEDQNKNHQSQDEQDLNNAQYTKQALIDTTKSLASHLSNTVATILEANDLSLLSPTIQLRDYQLEGLKWLKWLHLKGMGGILADEMGLGKTLQAIAFLSFVLNHRPSSKSLIVVPLSVLNNWVDEWSRFCPSVNTIAIYGSKEERLEQIQQCGSRPWSILLTTFEVFSSELEFFKTVSWEVLVVDVRRMIDSESRLIDPTTVEYRLYTNEAHRLKNPKSLLFTNLSELNVNQRFLLTGTPVQNNLNELQSLLAFSIPNVFGFDRCSLSEWFRDDETTLSGLLAPFMLRRRKEDVLSLPEKKEIILRAPLTSLQRRLYKAILTKDLQAFETKRKSNLNNILVQLRKCVNHPYLFDGIEPEPFEAGDHLFTASGKMIVLDELLNFLFERKKRVLIFSQMTHFLDIVQDFLTYRGYNYERLDGSVRAQERYMSINSFQNDEKSFVFLLSTRAGGVGLNLTAADTVIFLDSDFNPTADEQAAARVHRIGQEKETVIFRILCPNTIDEIIYKRARSKIALQRVLRDANRLTADPAAAGSKSSSTDMDSEDLISVLIYGLDSILSPQKLENEADQIKFESRAEIDIMIEEIHNQIEHLFETDLDVTIKKDPSSAGHSTFQADGNNDSSSRDMYEFEGVDYKQYQEALNQLRDLSISSNMKRKAEDDEEETERQKLLEERLKNKKEADKKKRQQKLETYALLGYESLEFDDHQSLQSALARETEELDVEDNNNVLMQEDNQNQIQYVIGDVTRPNLGPDERCFIVHVVDASGEWPHLGVFRAITSHLGPKPSQYYTSSGAPNIRNLARGSTHFIQISPSTCVVLIVAQRRRDAIELAPFEQGLAKVAKVAKTIEASVHLPRIGDKLPNVNWYAIERIIRKQLVQAGIPTFVYYFRQR